jgi:Uma2 family endonuclease
MEAGTSNNFTPPTNYADYLQTANEERWEIIDGVPYNMVPSPSLDHQNIVSNLQGEFYAYLKGKECRSFVAPFDVRLHVEGKSNHEIKNVVQPDLTIVCDKSKLDDKGCNGTPDMVIEVLSPATAKRDRSDKLKLYKVTKVKEYWIIDPFNKTVEVNRIQDNVFGEPVVYGENEKIQVGIFEDMVLELQHIFL